MPRHRYFLTPVFMVALIAYGHAQDEHMKAALKELEGPVYGKGCGWVGTDPAPRIQLEGLLHYRDSLGVVAMLHDEDTVYQVYGAEGVIRLQRSGMKFPELIVHRVEKLRRSTKKIKVCSGCFHSEPTIQEALRMFIE